MSVHTSLSSHCLDTAIGKPAANLKLTLQMEQEGEWKTLGSHSTDGIGVPSSLVVLKADDGRVTGKVWGDVLPGTGAGKYRIVFYTKDYFENHGISSYLYPGMQMSLRADEFLSEIPILFEITPALTGTHFHIPLLLSPFGYSTYRGS
jgi:5-hydroxyisourate hydrolase